MKKDKTIKTEEYIDEKSGAFTYLEGLPYSEMSRKIRRKFVISLIIFIGVFALVIYMNVTGRIPFYGNFSDEVYKAKVQHYYDVSGIDEKVDPNLTYEKDNPYKTHESEAEEAQ